MKWNNNTDPDGQIENFVDESFQFNIVNATFNGTAATANGTVSLTFSAYGYTDYSLSQVWDLNIKAQFTISGTAITSDIVYTGSPQIDTSEFTYFITEWTYNTVIPQLKATKTATA